MPEAVNQTAWVIGFAIAAAVVVVVVLLVGTILYLAAKIRRQAYEASAALVEARDNTAPLWEVAEANRWAAEILAGLQKARAGPGE